MCRENELWTDYIRSIINAKLALKQWKQKQKQIAPASETLTRLYIFFKHRESGFYIYNCLCNEVPLIHSLPKSNRGYCIKTYFTHIVDFYMNEPVF